MYDIIMASGLEEFSKIYARPVFLLSELYNKTTYFYTGKKNLGVYSLHSNKLRISLLAEVKDTNTLEKNVIEISKENMAEIFQINDDNSINIIFNYTNGEIIEPGLFSEFPPKDDDAKLIVYTPHPRISTRYTSGVLNKSLVPLAIFQNLTSNNLIVKSNYPTEFGQDFVSLLLEQYYGIKPAIRNYEFQNRLKDLSERMVFNKVHSVIKENKLKLGVIFKENLKKKSSRAIVPVVKDLGTRINVIPLKDSLSNICASALPKIKILPYCEEELDISMDVEIHPQVERITFKKGVLRLYVKDEIILQDAGRYGEFWEAIKEKIGIVNLVITSKARVEEEKNKNLDKGVVL